MAYVGCHKPYCITVSTAVSTPYVQPRVAYL